MLLWLRCLFGVFSWLGSMCSGFRIQFRVQGSGFRFQVGMPGFVVFVLASVVSVFGSVVSTLGFVVLVPAHMVSVLGSVVSARWECRASWFLCWAP